MSRWKPSSLLALTAVICLSSCGGDSSTGQSAEGSRRATVQEQSSGPGSKQGQRALPDYEGGEESIEDFGSEAEGSEERAILAAEQAYLSALVERNYARACSHLATSATESLTALLPSRVKDLDCAQILPRLLSPSASATAREQLAGKVTKLRVHAERAFIIFHAPGARLYTFPMVRENGRWKLTLLSASILIPSAETLK